MLSYHFSRLARAVKEPSPAALQERRQTLTSILLERLKPHLNDTNCTLHYTPVDAGGSSRIFITHKDAPKLSFMYRMECEWSPALEATGVRAAFRLYCPNTKTNKIFYFGDSRTGFDSHANRLQMESDASPVARFLTAEATLYARRKSRTLTF